MKQTYSEGRPANYIRPIYLARQVLTEAGITSFPVDLRIILRHFGICLIRYVDLVASTEVTLSECFAAYGKDGATVWDKGKYVIVYNHEVTPKDRIRFTIAHELGHIVLRHHNELGVRVLRRFWVEKSLYDVMEDEANCFARNLLCPPLSTAELLRQHGLVATQFDEKQQRNIWQKVSTAPCLPGTPESIRDFVLVRQAFFITDKAAKTRCHFLKQDLQNLLPKDRDLPYSIKHGAQWRCIRCGAPRPEDGLYCYHCGARNHFGFVYREDAPAQPKMLPYHGTHFQACPFCGNTHLSEDALHCMLCGMPVTNPCIPNLSRGKTASSALAHLDVQSRHLCPPGVRYCPTCGSRTLFSAVDIDDNAPILTEPADPDLPFCQEEQKKPAGQKDPYKMNTNLRLLNCLYCGRARHDRDACFCVMCGRPVINACTGCSHRNIALAKYCEKCGQPTAFLTAGFLPEFSAYHTPPSPPEGVFCRTKRMDDKYRQEHAERQKEKQKRLKELLKQYE